MSLPLARLRVLASFQGFSDEELREVARRMRGVVLDKDAVVDEADPTRLWLVLEGHLVAEREMSEGGRIEVGRYGPGAVVSSGELVGGMPADVRLLVSERCLAAELDEDVLEEWVGRGDPVAVRFFQLLVCSLVRQLRQTNACLAELVCMSELRDMARSRGLLH